jgi:hypothetical protein
MKMKAMTWMTAAAPRPTTTAVVKVTAAERAELERVLRQVDNMSDDIRRAFLETVDRASRRVDVAEIADMIRVGRIGEAINVVQGALSGGSVSPLTAAITAAAVGAGEAAAAAMPEAPVGIAFTFAMTNPKTVSALRAYEFKLVRELSQQTRENLATVVRAGVSAGRNPLQVAQDIRDYVGLTARQSQAVANYRRMLEEGDGDALKRLLRDRTFDADVNQALVDREPLPQRVIDKLVERYRRRYLKYRSETIARTEAMRAVSFGNQAAWQQAVEDGQFAEDEVRRFWKYTHDKKTRDAHRLIPEMNPDGVGLDEPFDTILGPLMYPGDEDADPANTINCRCAVFTRYVPNLASRARMRAEATDSEEE